MEVRVRTLPSTLVLPAQIVTKSPPQYFTLPTTMAAVGTRGSGKTYSLMLWNKWMFDHGFFTRFYIISPTYESNDPLKTVGTRPGDIYTSVRESVKSLESVVTCVEQDVQWYEEIENNYTDAYKKYKKVRKDISKLERPTLNYLRSMQNSIKEFYQGYNDMHKAMAVKSLAIEYCLSFEPTPPVKTLDSVLGVRYDDMHPWFYPPPKMKKPVPLLFIDDCSHSPIYSLGLDNPLVNLTLRHRHIGGQGYGLSIQFAVQTFKTGVPKALRQNTMQFLIFKTNDSKVLLDIYEELGAFCVREEFFDVYSRAIKKKHDFLLIDLNAPSEDRIFRRGWDTFLILSRQIDAVPDDTSDMVSLIRNRVSQMGGERGLPSRKRKKDTTTDEP